MTQSKASEYFDKGFICAESVLLAVSESCGIKSDLIPGIATGFGSGLARTCGMCGALSGATIAISLVHGRKTENDDLEVTYSMIQELRDEFSKNFGSENCFNLTGCDFNTPEGNIKFKDNHLKSNLCMKIVSWTSTECIKLINQF